MISILTSQFFKDSALNSFSGCVAQIEKLYCKRSISPFGCLLGNEPGVGGNFNLISITKKLEGGPYLPQYSVHTHCEMLWNLAEI